MFYRLKWGTTKRLALVVQGSVWHASMGGGGEEGGMISRIVGLGALWHSTAYYNSNRTCFEQKKTRDTTNSHPLEPLKLEPITLMPNGIPINCRVSGSGACCSRDRKAVSSIAEAAMSKTHALYLHLMCVFKNLIAL